nr:olfactory receptor 14I1-like [Anolis sagrei ordinatus]
MDIDEQKPINKSSLSEFLLLEFSEVWEIKLLYFGALLTVYLTTAAGNILIIAGIISDYHLHTPMYFFLMNLAIQDVGQVSVIFPKSMANSLMNTRSISYCGCVAQVFFYTFFVASDFSLLTVMAYDRYVAICNPLQYEVVMNRQACLQMLTAVVVINLFYGVLHTGGTFAPSFCSNVVNQFFCELPHLLKLVCSDLYLVEVGAIFLSAMVLFGCFIFIIVTYVHIFTTVMRMPSIQTRQKAFSTCLPHLTVCSIFVVTGLLAYLKPTSNSPTDPDLALAMIYSIVPPLINPVIYSMRNKEIKNAVRTLLSLRFRNLILQC